MKCYKCGRNNPSDSTFCNGCATELATQRSHAWNQSVLEPNAWQRFMAKTSLGQKGCLALVGVFLFLGIVRGILNNTSQPRIIPTEQGTSQTPLQSVAPSNTPPASYMQDLPPAQMRGILLESYQAAVSTANPHLNLIKSNITKMKGGYALWLVHSFFTSSSFQIGDDVKVVSAWIDSHRAELDKAQIKRVGFKNESGYLGECWLDLK